VDRDGRRRAGVPIAARETLIEELRRHALVVGEVTLTSGATAQYYVDAKRAVLRPAGFAALAELVAAYAARWEATAVGGLTMGADAPACAALAGGADVKAFFIRKETKQHGLQRRIEGPFLDPGDRCLIVEDVVTTGGSTLQAIDAVREAGHPIAGVVTVLDRLAGGAERIREAAGGAPYEALATIDDVYPERPDRG
jgi:orotate phosphoribosyltransferase